MGRLFMTVTISLVACWFHVSFLKLRFLCQETADFCRFVENESWTRMPFLSATFTRIPVKMNMSPVWPHIKTGKEYASLVFLEVPLKALYCATLMHRPTQVDSITVLCFIYVDQGSCLVWNDVGFLSKAVLTMLCFICE